MKKAVIFAFLVIFSLSFFQGKVSAATKLQDPIYRFWSNTYQTHFYTSSEAEKNDVINNYDDKVWKYEGIAYYADAKCEDIYNMPVYRFWNDRVARHFYTANSAEKNHLIKTQDQTGWQYEGIVFCTSLKKASGLAPVYRFWSNSNSSHFYTISSTEMKSVMNGYNDSVWKYESIEFYAKPVEKQAAPYKCSSDIYNCNSFTKQTEAQAMFDYCMKEVGKDIHKLDQDNDLRVCESM